MLVNQQALEKLSRGPVIRPGGLEVAFYSNVSGNTFLYLMNADGTNIRRLPLRGFPVSSPQWSPDGTQLLAINGSVARPFLVHPNGSQYELLGDESTPPFREATFSPDGRSLYATTREPLPLLWKIQLAPLTFTKIDTGNIVAIASPRFSSDGKALAFVGYQSATQRGVYLAKPDGSDAHLVANTSDARRVLWSPANGLAFEGNEGLYTIERNGSNRRFIIAGGEFDWR